MKARTCSRGGIGFHRLLTGFLLAILVATATPAVAQSLLMPTRSENLDGTTKDIAAENDPTGDPSKRAWIAQGRARMAIQMSTRTRMPDEDRVFTKAHDTYPYSAPTLRERVIAVEVNEERVDGVPYLYTLTESGLYREEIGNPSNEVWLPLVDICNHPELECIDPSLNHFAYGEEMVDIKVWNHATSAQSGKIILLTDRRVVVIRDRDAALTVKSSADELLNSPNGALKWTAAPHSNPRSRPTSRPWASSRSWACRSRTRTATRRPTFEPRPSGGPARPCAGRSSSWAAI
jgi:hypothetical protein